MPLSKRTLPIMLILLLAAMQLLSKEALKNQINIKTGKPDGLWVQYYDAQDNTVSDWFDCKYYREVNYNNGVISGKVKFIYKYGKPFFEAEMDSLNPPVFSDQTIDYYQENGNLMETVTMKDNHATGPATRYNENGEKIEEGDYTDGVRTGVWKFYTSGRLTSEGEIENEKRQGMWTIYYEDGSYLKGRQENNDFVGVCKPYSKDGVLRNEGTLKDGKRNGLWTFYKENGDKDAQGYYVDDVKEGDWAEHIEDGKIAKGKYKDNKRTGEWVVYSPTNVVLSRTTWQDDKLNGQATYYNDQGNVVQMVIYKDGVVQQ